MSELLFSPVFQEVSHMFSGQTFSAMYYGRHFGKDLLILKHDLTLMVIFRNDKWPTPELIKSISFRGKKKKGVQIAGNKNVILLLDECGLVWKLINAFDISNEKDESLHSLEKECFYEWVPFKKFNFVKVLALSAFGHGFACLGLDANLAKKLVVIPSLNSTLEDYSFEDLNSNSSSSYYLTNFNINYKDLGVNNTHKETLVVADRFSGKTYLCKKFEKNSLINVSNNNLISAMHLESKNCLLLSFENGKLIFIFCNEFKKQFPVYLSRKIVFIKQCCCNDSCLLWSDGENLNHTNLTIQGSDYVKVSHLKLNCFIQSPVSLLKVGQQAILVTINNFYYYIRPGKNCAERFEKQPQQVLSEICQGSSLTEALERKTDMLAYFLQCKDVIQKGKINEKIDIKWEGNRLVIKSTLNVPFREEHWKIRLMRLELHKKFVHLVNLENDFSKGMLITVENPFKSKCKLKVSLVGHFEENYLFVDLGEVGEFESNSEKNQLSEKLQKMLRKRTKFYVNGT